MLYKIFWVFQLKYTPSVNLFYKFIEYFICEQSTGRNVTSIRELAVILKQMETAIPATLEEER